MMPADANVACADDYYPFEMVLENPKNSKAYWASVNEAKKVCARCDFRAECMAELGTEPGVVAGKTEEERKRDRKGEAA